MSSTKQTSPRGRGDDSLRRRLLEEPSIIETLGAQIRDLKRDPSLSSLKQLASFLFSCLLVVVLSRVGPAARARSRRRTRALLQRTIRFTGAVGRRLGTVTLSTGLVFSLYIAMDILSPKPTRSGSEDQEVSLGSLLLPPGQKDTLSDDDGWETLDSIQFPEPPPDDFGDLPLPAIETYTFEASTGFRGDELEESAAYIEEFFGQIRQTDKRPELPTLTSLKAEADPIPTEIPTPVPRIALVPTPRIDITPTSESPAEPAVMSHIVKRGENLWRICRKYGLKMSDVVAYNRISKPSRLKPGTEILLPGRYVPTNGNLFRFPLEQVDMSSGYGMRTHPILHQRMFHRGIDLRANRGTPVYAAATGTVVFARRDGGKGNTIVIDHGNGLKTVYAHLSSFLAKTGQRVEAGQVIAKTGATGRVSAPHLHFEVWRNGSHANPLAFLPPIPRSPTYTQR